MMEDTTKDLKTRSEELFKSLNLKDEGAALKIKKLLVDAITEKDKEWEKVVEQQTKDHAQKVVEIETKLSQLEVDNGRLKIEVGNWKRNAEDLTKKSKKLKERIECPVCLEAPRKGPVYVCPNGHTVCNNCKKDTCPSCRQNMGGGKSLLALAIIENINHRCSFTFCEESFALDKLDEHEKVCAHRTVSCPDLYCEEKVPLSKLKDHLINDCYVGDGPIVLENLENGGYKEQYTNDSTESSTSWCINLFDYEETSFGLLAEKIDDLYGFSMVLFGSQKECSKFKINIDVYELGAETCEDSETKFNYSGPPCSIDIDKPGLKYQGLVVNEFGMVKVMDSERSFNVSVKVLKK